MRRATYIAVFVAALLFASPGFGDWYDDYQAGIKAARAGNWRTVVEKMNAAIATKSAEDPRARPYGNVFVNYRPYYYRGMAHYELQNWQSAIDDLERTGGAGELNLGSTESKIMRATNELRSQATPTPTRAPATPTPEIIRPPVTPTREPTRPPFIPPTPTVAPFDTTSARDARARALRSLEAAQAERAEAASQKAESLARQEFTAGMASLNRAQSLMVGAQTAADWNVVGTTAESARSNFAKARQRASQPLEEILAQTRARVRTALEAYFDGRYDEARQQFQILASQQSSNALLWAFHGAAAYSLYYIDGQRIPALRTEAEASFRRAKSLRLRELPASYFSPRIRRFYASLR